MMTPLSDLQHQREWIAIEAFSARTMDFPDLLARCLPAAKQAFLGFVNHFVPSEQGISLNRNQRDFLKVVDNHKYLDLAPTAAYVPEGLKVSYLHYANILGPAVDHVIKVQETLSTYTTYLAMLLTNRDQRFSTKDSAVVYKAMELKRAELNNDLGSCFQNSSHRTNVTYGDVVERNSEWPNVFHAMEKLNLLISSVDRKNLQRNIDNAVELIDRLLDLVKRDELKDASPNIALELSDGAFQVASELELLSSIHYRCLAFTASVNRTTESVVRIYNH